MLGIRRKKGIYTAIFLVSCFVYVNWLVNISDWKSEKAQSQKLNEAKYFEESFAVFEQNTNNDYYDQPKEHKINDYYEVFGSFSLTEVEASQPGQMFSLLNSGLNTPKEKMFFYEGEKLSSEELDELVKLLGENQAVLLDLDCLSNVEFKEEINEKKLFIGHNYHVNNFHKFENYLNLNNKKKKKKKKNLESIKITFGVDSQAFLNLNKAIIEKLSSKCKYVQKTGFYSNVEFLTSVYVDCGELLLQISIFYARGSFFWTGKERKVLSPKLEFGDVARAIGRFERAKLTDNSGRVFNVPSDLKRFLFDYDHSKFKECDKFLAKKNLEKLGDKYAQNEKRNAMIAPVTQYISESLENFNKHYWLAGGTLLGWYRDCGIIPHTQDVDMAIWAHEYDLKVKKHFLGNKVVRVWGTLGLVNDSYEFRMYNDQFTFDMFLVYKTNSTHQWCGYQVNRVKFKRWLPNFDELCSAELLNHKYMVPCDPVRYLNKEYGPGYWHTPQSTNYTWTNVVYYQNWTDAEWPNTIKYYDRNGFLLKEKVLAYVNKHLKHNVTTLEPDDVDV